MPREPIVGSGRKGFGFEQKGFQEKNLQLFLETISKKETQKSIEALSKIDKDEWKAIATTATQLNSFISLGDTTGFLANMATSIKNTIKLQIDSLFSTLTNEINQGITNALQPLIDLLIPLINELSTFIANNTLGAGLGGIAGMVIAYFLPGGSFWVVLGAAIGAEIEESIGRVGDPLIPTTDLSTIAPIQALVWFKEYLVWVQSNPGKSFRDYLEYIYGGGDTLGPGENDYRGGR